jgi:hypothetical protein
MVSADALAGCIFTGAAAWMLYEAVLKPFQSLSSKPKTCGLISSVVRYSETDPVVAGAA